MSVTVVDASAVAAVVFDEPESKAVLASVAGSLIAPSLLPYELASVCATKLARRPSQADTILSRYGLLDALEIQFLEPDWRTLPRLAYDLSLSVYDAAYLQIALAHRVPLVTLDARLAQAYDRASGKT